MEKKRKGADQKKKSKTKIEDLTVGGRKAKNVKGGLMARRGVSES